MKHFVITIGREFGSLGLKIGQELSSMLNVNCYDKELLKMSAAKLNCDINTVNKADEVMASDIEGLGTSYAIKNFYLSTKVLDAQAEVIEELADKESCIIVGRCSDYILSERNDCLKVYIYAPFKVRVKHIMQKYKISEFSAKRMVKKVDKQRDEYYKYVTGIDRCDHRDKNLLLDSSQLGVEGSAKMIYNMVLEKFKEEGSF